VRRGPLTHGNSDREISPLCDLRATAFAATARYGASIRFFQRRAFCDDGLRCERRQTVFAQSLRMACAARQRDGLRFHYASVLIARRGQPRHSASGWGAAGPIARAANYPGFLDTRQISQTKANPLKTSQIAKATVIGFAALGATVLIISNPMPAIMRPLEISSPQLGDCVGGWQVIRFVRNASENHH
jgi:hypothetical protein